jgi:hypothetical protein
VELVVIERSRQIPDLELTSAQLDIIDRAREAFARDFRYLEQILWSARARGSEVAASLKSSA